MVISSNSPQKVIDMAKEPADIVASFVANHALVDKHLAAAYRAAMKMAKETEDGIKAGMVTQIEAKLFLAQHRAAAGEIANVAALFAELHKSGTAIAKANGVDLGNLTTVGGVALPQPEFTTMSGGR